MAESFAHTVLGRTGLAVHRLGLSATYRPGKEVVHKALDVGMNYFFAYGFDTQMTHVLRGAIGSQRDQYVIATGAYNLVLGHPNLRRTLEKRLRQFGTDSIDIFLFLGVMKEKHFPERTREELCRLKETGKVRFVGISTHHRKLAGKLVAEGAVDVLMIRYNAAHRGAEEEIFPHTRPHDPGIVSYTATRWTYLLHRPRNWPAQGRIPTAGMCYRFVLSCPHVHVCLTAPSNLRQLQENIEAVRQGPLSEDEMGFMRQFGDAVHASKRWFM